MVGYEKNIFLSGFSHPRLAIYTSTASWKNFVWMIIIIMQKGSDSSRVMSHWIYTYFVACSPSQVRKSEHKFYYHKSPSPINMSEDVRLSWDLRLLLLTPFRPTTSCTRISQFLWGYFTKIIRIIVSKGKLGYLFPPKMSLCYKFTNLMAPS